MFLDIYLLTYTSQREDAIEEAQQPGVEVESATNNTILIPTFEMEYHRLENDQASRPANWRSETNWRKFFWSKKKEDDTSHNLCIGPIHIFPANGVKTNQQHVA